jgi:hypothetical protein
MAKSWALLVGLVLGLGTATVTHASVVKWKWSGTLIVNLGALPDFKHFGTGLAMVNGSSGSGYGHLNTLRLAGGLSYTGGNNVPETIPMTNPADPGGWITLRATGIRLGTLTLNEISGGPPLGSKNTGVQPGRMKFCFLFPGCGSYTPIPLGTKGGQGVGVGGMFTLNTFSQGGGYRHSLQGAPWTIGIASIRNVTTTTPNGGISTYTKTIQGFVHGPGSNTSNTLNTSGVLQLVTPVFVQTNQEAPETFQAWWLEVRLRFIPEPNRLLLLGSGVAALLLLGRSRRRGS